MYQQTEDKLIADKHFPRSFKARGGRRVDTRKSIMNDKDKQALKMAIGQ